MIPNFTSRTIRTSAGIDIHTTMGGNGPPLLLLHGFPETHLCWRKIAPELAKTHTVVAPDLRGYGASSKPDGGADHAAYSKRAMAQDQVDVMAALGFSRFALIGHDRGARVSARLALDHPQAVSKVAVLDIAPTAAMYGATDKRFANVYWHWFFLIQPPPLPETMIGKDPDFFIRYTMTSWNQVSDAFDEESLAAYVAAFRTPNGVHGPCEDYRASAAIDLTHDKEDADKRITAPLLALWGEKAFVARAFDVLAEWRKRATTVSGQAIPCGHFLPEEAPKETLAALQAFLRDG
jgi:haloacetate dehalogenase